MPKWIEVNVTTVAELEDSVGSFLIDCGAPGLQSEPVGAGVRVTAHFENSAPLREIRTHAASLHELFPELPEPAVETRDLTTEDWAENWKDHFPPQEIGTRLFIHPPWITSVPAGRIGIVLDPGMAFGTGHHATTRLCLTLLDEFAARTPLGRVLDLGTGSGILAIAAVKLGAAEVWAVDNDPDVLPIANENAAANGVADRINVSCDLLDAGGGLDLILANILATPLIELAPRLAALCRPRATVIGSGLLAEEADAVSRAWGESGLCVERVEHEREWAALVARAERPPSR